MFFFSSFPRQNLKIDHRKLSKIKKIKWSSEVKFYFLSLCLQLLGKGGNRGQEDLFVRAHARSTFTEHFLHTLHPGLVILKIRWNQPLIDSVFVTSYFLDDFVDVTKILVHELEAMTTLRRLSICILICILKSSSGDSCAHMRAWETLVQTITCLCYLNPMK